MREGKDDVDRRAYGEASLVALYARSGELQPAEAALFGRLKPDLADMDVLDLGVGAGRTALHFAPASRSYLGVDYAAPMIEECRRRLPGVRFLVGDARSMDFAADTSFDLVLFSYNGVDHLTAAERAQFLLEARRILRPGGILVFSSHNANYIPVIIERYRFRLGPNVRESLRALKWAAVFQLRNCGLASRLPFEEGRMSDGVHSFKSAGVYYIRPDLQIAALRRLGMEEISCAANNSADFVPADDARVRQFDSPWVYYFCRKPRA